MKDKIKEIIRNSSAEKILETFQSCNLVTEDWNLLADQVLTMGVQKIAVTILKNSETIGDEGNNAGPGFSDGSGESEVPVRRSERRTKKRSKSFRKSCQTFSQFNYDRTGYNGS